MFWISNLFKLKPKVKWYFDVREFCITDNPVPHDVVDKIVKNHMEPMSRVRHKFGRSVIVSKRSGYRPVDYELSKDRSGRSQHTFRGLGAADYTHSGDWNEFIRLVVQNTDYNRLCWYPNNKFLHADFAGDGDFFTADSPSAPWVFKDKLIDFTGI